MRRRLLAELLLEWELDLEEEPLQSTQGLVAFVRRGNTQFVLKILSTGTLESLRASRYFAGHGAVKVFAGSQRGAILLERAIPGFTLQFWRGVRDQNDEALRLILTERAIPGFTLYAGRRGWERDDKAMRILCKVITLLHSRPAPLTGFPLLKDRMHTFETVSARNPRSLELIDKARSMFRALYSSQGDLRLCHGDLHQENIVFDKQRGWLAIDPHGVIAEPEFEVAASLRNWTDEPPYTITPNTVERQIAIASEELGLDRQRMIGWAFCDSIYLAIQAVTHKSDPRGFLAAAEVLHPLLR